MALKPVRWLGNARAVVRAFPPNARRDAGYQLYRVQAGHRPSDWKPMTTVGPGVREIRIHADGEYRVLYWRRDSKRSTCCTRSRRSASARPKWMDLARARLKELFRRRARE